MFNFLGAKELGFISRHHINKLRWLLAMQHRKNLAQAALSKSPTEAVEAIFADLPPRRFLKEPLKDRSAQDKASQLAFAYGRSHMDTKLFLRTARQLLCVKTTINAHDVKFPAAVFEDSTTSAPTGGHPDF